MIINRLCQIFFLFFCVVLFACQEKEPLTDNPVVITGGVLTSEKNVVNFAGSLLSNGDASPIDYGFVWSNKNMNPSISDYIFRFRKKPTKGSFNAEIDYDLIDNPVSYVRAFVETRDAIVYGEVSEFKTKPSLSPVVISISPVVTTGNDTITILGNHLTSKISDVSVQYQYNRLYSNWPTAKVVYADGKKIKFILSNTPLTTSSDIFLSIKIRGIDIYPKGKVIPPIYVNVGPQITGFSPRQVSKDGIVKIGIKNLVGSLDHFTLYSKEYAYTQEILGIEGDSIKIKLNNLRYGSYQIKLFSTYNGQAYNCVSKDSLEVKHPEITGIVENSPLTGDSITIIGKYFNKTSLLEVSNLTAYSSNAGFKFISDSKCRAAIPEVAFDGESYLFFNSFDGYISKFPLYVRSNWSLKSKLNDSLREGVSVLFGDKIILGSWNTSFYHSSDIFIYDTSSGTLNLLTKLPEDAYYQLAFINGSKLYLFQGRYVDSTNGTVAKDYCFDLNLKVWTPIESSGWPKLDGLFATCSFNGKTYLKQNNGTKVYLFDPSANSWQFINNALNTSGKTFMIENQSGLYLYYPQYLYGNSSYYTKISVSKLDESSNKWLSQPDLENIQGMINYMQNSNGYLWFVSSGRIFKYSLAGKLIKSFQNGFIGRDYPNCQFSGDKLYSVITFSGSSNYLIEFDPNKY